MTSFTGLEFAAPAVKVTDTGFLGTVQTNLNGQAALAKLGGACRTVESIAWRATTAQKVVTELNTQASRLKYVATTLTGGDARMTYFTLKGGGRTVLGGVQLGPVQGGTRTMAVHLCDLAPVAAARPATAPVATPQTATPAQAAARLPPGRYVCSRFAGSLMLLGDLRIRPDGTYQGIQLDGGGYVGTYSYNPASDGILWKGDLGGAFGPIVSSFYKTGTQGEKYIEINYQTQYLNTMSCSREGP